MRLTKDRHVAVMPDRRVDRTTTGRGPVGTLTLAELQSLDAGSWFDKKFEGARAPSLQEVFDATGDSPTPSWPASTRWPWPPSLGSSHR